MLRILLILFCLSLLVSQTAMDVFASLLVLSILFVWLRAKMNREVAKFYFSMGWDWLWLVWIAVVGLGFVIQWNPEANWAGRLIEFKWIPVFYSILAVLNWSRPDERVIKWGAGFLAFCSLYAVVIFFLGFDPIKQADFLPREGGSMRTGGFLGNYMTFAHLYGLIFCLGFGLLIPLFRWQERDRWLVLLTLVLTGTGIILSFTRGVWISLSIASLVIAFIYSKRLGILVAFGGAIAAGLIYFVVPGVQDRVQYALEGGDSERIWIWTANLEMFKEHPVLGVGYGENTVRLSEYYQKVGAPEGLIISHAHNQYLNMLAGTGVLGLLIYLFIWGYFLFLNWRVLGQVNRKDTFQHGLAMGCLGAQVCFLIGSLTESNFEHSKLKYTLCLIWALVVWLSYEVRVLRERL